MVSNMEQSHRLGEDHEATLAVCLRLIEYTTQQVGAVNLVNFECCHDIGSHGDGSDEGRGEERERVK